MKDLKIKVNGTEISIESSPVMSKEDGNVPAPQAPAKKKGHGGLITGLILLGGLGAVGYVAAGGSTGISGAVTGAKAANATLDKAKAGAALTGQNFSVADNALMKAEATMRGAAAGRQAALNGGGKLMQKAAGAASVMK